MYGCFGVFASLAGTPFLARAIKPKVTAFADRIRAGQTYELLPVVLHTVMQGRARYESCARDCMSMQGPIFSLQASSFTNLWLPMLSHCFKTPLPRIVKRRRRNWHAEGFLLERGGRRLAGFLSHRIKFQPRRWP